MLRHSAYHLMLASRMVYHLALCDIPHPLKRFKGLIVEDDGLWGRGEGAVALIFWTETSYVRRDLIQKLEHTVFDEQTENTWSWTVAASNPNEDRDVPCLFPKLFLCHAPVVAIIKRSAHSAGPNWKTGCLDDWVPGGASIIAAGEGTIVYMSMDMTGARQSTTIGALCGPVCICVGPRCGPVNDFLHVDGYDRSRPVNNNWTALLNIASERLFGKQNERFVEAP